MQVLQGVQNKLLSLTLIVHSKCYRNCAIPRNFTAFLSVVFIFALVFGY